MNELNKIFKPKSKFKIFIIKFNDFFENFDEDVIMFFASICVSLIMFGIKVFNIKIKNDDN